MRIFGAHSRPGFRHASCCFARGAVPRVGAPRVGPRASAPRATNVTLPETLLREARGMGINLSQACERGLAAAVAGHRRERWLAENREAISAWNEHVSRHGLSLDDFRQF